MQRISSKDNNLIKKIKRLKEKKYRDEYGEELSNNLIEIDKELLELLKQFIMKVIEMN